MGLLNLIWKVTLTLGIILGLVAFILGWIGFGVPDWHAFRHYNTSIEEYYGLWAYCQNQGASYGTVCERWPTAENQLFNGSRPSFIRTSEGLITTGMILLSLSLAVAIIAALLPYLVYVGALIALVSAIFLVIGVPIFGRQSNALSVTKGDALYNKRYGFWLMIPTIILEFIAAFMFFITALAYQYLGYGNIATASKKVYGGKNILGPPNMIIGAPPMYGQSYLTSSNQLFPNDGLLPAPYPSITPRLLSQYLHQRSLESYENPPPIIGPPVLPPPPIIQNIAPSTSAASVLSVGSAPSYLRIGEPVGPRYTPIINLTGQTLVGPLTRTM